MLNSNSESLCDSLSVDIRHGFIRKVYGLLSFQLILTCAIAAPLAFSKAAETWIRANPAVLTLCLVAPLILCCVMCCAPNLMRKTPWNYLILAIFTVAEGVMVGMFSAGFEPTSVMLAFGMTATIVVALTAFAFQTKYDFTGLGPYLFVALICLSLTGFVAMLFGGMGHFAYKLYACAGATIFGFYLVYDTQLIVGGSHRQHQLSIDDYAMATLMLYLDIINLFVYILSIVGERRD